MNKKSENKIEAIEAIEADEILIGLHDLNVIAGLLYPRALDEITDEDIRRFAVYVSSQDEYDETVRIATLGHAAYQAGYRIVDMPAKHIDFWPDEPPANAIASRVVSAGSLAGQKYQRTQYIKKAR